MARNLLVALGREHHGVVGQHHALGRPGRTRGVDDGGQVGRFGDGGGGVEVDGLGRGELGPAGDVPWCQPVGVAYDDDVAEVGELVPHLQHPLQEADVLHHRDRRLRVAGQVFHLLGGG
jgi:hypothetical protein